LDPFIHFRCRAHHSCRRPWPTASNRRLDHVRHRSHLSKVPREPIVPLSIVVSNVRKAAHRHQLARRVNQLSAWGPRTPRMRKRKACGSGHRVLSARVCRCSVGADPAIPGLWLLCGGRSSHLMSVRRPAEASKVLSNPQQFETTCSNL